MRTGNAATNLNDLLPHDYPAVLHVSVFPPELASFTASRTGHRHDLVQHWLGAEGMPRRYTDYLPSDGFTTLNTISTIGSFVLGASMLPFVCYAAVSVMPTACWCGMSHEGVDIPRAHPTIGLSVRLVPERE